MHELLEVVGHLLALAAMAVPFVVAWRLSRDIYGILVSMWKPFLIIVLALVPLYLLDAVYAVQYVLDLNIVPSSIEDPLFDIALAFSFLAIGYALILIRRSLDEYAAITSKLQEMKGAR